MSLSWKDNVTRSFDKNSTTYDQNCDIQKTIADHLIADLPNSEVSDILELGCGTGNLTQHLLRKYPNQNFCITDISASMIEAAKIKFPDKNIRWALLDGEAPDTSKRYDLIVASMVFQWFENIEESLDQLSKMLKPDGTLIYSIPGPESFKEWKQTLNALDLPIGILDFPFPSDIYKQEMIEQNHADAVEFLGSMKNIGAGRAKKDYHPLSVKQIKQACQVFDQSHGGTITWHVLYGSRQAPKQENSV